LQSETKKKIPALQEIIRCDYV